MNKYKKIASAVIATVMAGTMVASLAACTPGDDGGNSGTKQTVLTPKLDANSKLTYSDNTKVQLSIGYNNTETGITYTNGNIAGTDKANALGDTKLMGVAHTAGELKPGWKALQSQLKIEIEDKYKGIEAGKQIGNITNDKSINGLEGVSVFTASAASINDERVNNTLLDISKYLDYMPNYKAFLESNDVVYASLIANKEGSMYMVPYFDGNDDIEKFVLLRKDLTSQLLDATDIDTNASKFISFKAQADAKNGATTKPVKDVVGTTSSVEAFMGGTAADSYEIEVTNPVLYTYDADNYGSPVKATGVAANTPATVKVYVRYDKALAAAKESGSSLNTALKAAGLTDAEITALASGNIVDLQNAVIKKSQGEVTGDKLLNILNAYIDAAYLTAADGTSFYTTSNSNLKRSDVFNSASAAWDVDLYVALGRCFVTSGTYLGDQVKSSAELYLIAGREYTTQRTTDVASLAGELYGVRGLESRYNYTYIDKDNNVKDARQDAKTFDTVKKMNALAQEGLFNTANNVKKDHVAINSSSNTGIQTLSHHDYCQTQTADGYKNKNYNFGPILTPVSKWNDGTGEKHMRFTESWRGVKDGGIAVSYNNVKKDPERLSAVLAMIDYIYSVDGQILMTYGPYSSNGNVAEPNGLWYATESSKTLTEVATKTVEATNYAPAQYTVKDEYKDQCFVYNERVYEGTLYIDRNIPILTDENLGVFHAQSKNSFTNHARQFLGTCLPVGNKDQGFEYQCTSACGIAGSNVVNIALANGTVKHQYQTLNGKDDKGNYVGGGTAAAPNYWYTLVPTMLPYTNTQTKALGNSTGKLQAISGVGGAGYNLYVSSSKTNSNLLLELMYRGYDTTFTLTCIDNIDGVTKTMPADAAGCVALNNSLQMSTLMDYKTKAWSIVKDWYAARTTAQN